MGFTKNQRTAIDLKDHNILVSAAAGSGKTTVLVERIIERILDSDNPTDIDRILVLTFTNAAAAQMREKILEAIDARLKDDPENVHLAQQAVLVHNAQISTFHKFCHAIINEHFHEIDADPGLRVADEAECKLMMMDAAGSVIEDAYLAADDDFLTMVESYAPGKKDSALEELIFKIYNIAQSNPYPDKWLGMCEETYNISSVEELLSSKWMKDYFEVYSREASEIADYAERTLEAAKVPYGPAKYIPTLEADLELARALADADSFNKMQAVATEHKLMNLASIRSNGLSEEQVQLKDYVKGRRDDFKTRVGAVMTAVGVDLDRAVSDMQAVAPNVKVITEMVRAFSERFSKIKQDAGVMDFNDMEHMALSILSADDGKSAQQYRDYFEEIYVDEYQDSNLTQNELIRLIRRDGKDDTGNLFMVGDVKQSIYRFRMARPDLFLAKYDSFGTALDASDYIVAGFEDERECMKGVRVDLSDNFRSRHEVLDAANEIFEQIMTKECGGIVYDDAARLNYGGLFNDKTAPSDTPSDCDKTAPSDSDNSCDTSSQYKTECMLIMKDAEVDDALAEARTIGMRIHQIVGKMDVVDSKSGEMRKAEYGDIVILLRSLSGRSETYRQALTDMGIPVYVTTGAGYFGAREVDTLLKFLSVIDNPLSDIDMACVLRSPLGDFTDNELGMLRLTCRHSSLYEALKSAAEGRPDNPKVSEIEGFDAVIGKCARFLEYLEHYRKESEYMSVYEILREIIDGSYGDFARSSVNGNQAMANLNMLLNKAEAYGKQSYKGLFHFLRYMAQIRKYEIDFGEAGIVDENDDTVKVMTIHKSKGLEFPIVFVSALGKGRNRRDETGEFVTDADIGPGLNYVDLERRTERPTLLRSYIIKKLKTENLAEEIRVLYVALTRAKEKLIMTGVIDDWDKKFADFDAPLTSCETYVSLLAYANRHAEGENGFRNIEVSCISPCDLVFDEVKRRLSAEDSLDRMMEIINKASGRDDEACAGEGDGLGTGKSDAVDGKTVDIIQKLRFEYPHANDKTFYAKVSVSDLKKKDYEEQTELSSQGDVPNAYVPSFIREAEDAPNAGTFYGTAFHRILELWDYCDAPDSVGASDVDTFAGIMCERGRIDKLQLEAIKPSEVAGFLNSDIALRMRAAARTGKLFREQPFVLGIDPGQVTFCEDGSIKGAREDGLCDMGAVPDGDNMMLVQGIIDAYWIEDDGIVILDYKTDRVSKGQELIDRYHVQLEYYEQALARLLDMPVKEKLIYSSRLHETVKVV